MRCLVLLVACVGSISACSGDTAPVSIPQSQTPQAAARHLDSLYLAAAAADSTGDFATREAVLTIAELAPAFGATPTQISVTTVAHGDSAAGDSTIHMWTGFEIMLVSTPDTNWFWVAYADSNVTNAIVVELHVGGPLSTATVLTNDTIGVTTMSVFGALGQTAVGSACAPVTGLSNPGLANLAQGTCQLATFNSLMVGEFILPADVDPSFGKVVVQSTAWTGVIFQSGA